MVIRENIRQTVQILHTDHLNKSTAMNTSTRQYRNWVPGWATLLSIIACYGTLLLVALLSILGISVTVHTGAWAATIVLFAAVAALAIAANFRRHRVPAPLLLALAGVAIIAWVMFGSYNRIVELIGFAVLIAAAIWDRRVKAH